MRRFVTAAALIALPLTGWANSEAIDNNVKARQGYFQMLSLNMGTLSGMAKGEIDYDEDAAALAAGNIEALTGFDLPSLFIEGSASDAVPASAAKPDIWSKPEEFSAKFAGLTQAAAGTADAVKGGQANIGPVLQGLGGACKACHDQFREKR